MALPSSGEITIADIWTEYNGGATPGANENISLGTLSANTADGGGDPDAMSEFYGLSAVTIPDTSEYFAVNTYAGTSSSHAITGGKIGTAANFNGSGSYISTSGSPIPNGNNNFSVSFFINFNSLAGNQHLFGAGSLVTAFTHASYYVGGASSIVSDNNGNADTLTSSLSLSTGTWYHFVITYNSSTGLHTFYLNGTSSGSTTRSLNVTASTMEIGRRPYYNSNPLSAKLDQFRVFNKALSSSEVTTLGNETTSSNTKSKTDIFGDGSGVALYEFENGGLDTGGVSGYIGNGAIFNGSTSQIRTSSNPIPSTSSLFSISFWFKLNDTSTVNHIFSIFDGVSGTNKLLIRSLTSGDFQVGVYGTSGNNFINTTSATFSYTTDVWYHLVYISRSTGNNEFWINNSQIATSTGVAANTNSSTVPITLGGRGDYSSSANTERFNGELDQLRIFNKALSTSEINTLYTETSSTSSTADIFSDGSCTALYEFEGSSRDSSGNVGDTIVTLSSGSSSGYAYADSSVNTGKYYWEVDFFYSYYGNVGVLMVGAVNTNSKTTSWASGSNYFYYAGNGSKYSNGGSAPYSTAYNAPITIGVKLDMTNGTIGFTRNGTDLGTAYSGISGYYHPAVGTGIQADKCKFVFDSNDWKYSAPSGYSEWTAQITSPIIAGGGATAVQEIYSGTDTDVIYDYSGPEYNVSFEGTNFKPDFVWLRSRTQIDNHYLQDSVRGATRRLHSNLTIAEPGADSNRFSSFDTNGFTVGGDNSVNMSGHKYVAWAFKAAGASNTYNIVENKTLSTSSTASGVGISTSGANATPQGASINRDYGFGIIKNSVGSNYPQVIAHGYGSKPDLIITKPTTTSEGWLVTVNKTVFGSTYDKQLTLNTTGQASDVTNTSRQITDVLTTLTYTPGSQTFITYMFKSVEGYQKIGIYDGGDIGSGAEIVTGFRPRFILYKAYNASESWGIYDSVRHTSGYPSYGFFANTDDYEVGTETRIAFTPTGWYWKVTKSGNTAGRSYLYLAIA